MNEALSASCRTTCPYCGVGCGVLAADNGDGPSVTGDPDHPANAGRLCVKGASLHETLGAEGRLTRPMVNGQAVSWETALSRVSDAIRQSTASHGPESVGLYLSGQLLTEDYYVANKLAKGYIRTPHVDTNSRLCMSSAVAAHKRAFGADAVPGCYEDLELADLLVLVGSNTAWNHPILYQRMKAAHRDGRRVVVIDPRRTATSELADLHLSLRPGTDTHLFNGLLAALERRGVLDQAYLDAHCDGSESALAAAGQSAPDEASVAQACDLLPEDVTRFFDWFAATDRTVTVFSQGVNQAANGTDKGNAIINCHLATGRIGRAGATPFSVTGQPNAMGGREVGGLANTLAAHMDYGRPDHIARVARFWGVTELADGPGHKAVDLFDAVLRGDIQVLWIMATNPAVSLPDSERVREALRRCPTVIVSDCIANTDTTAYADILLPATGWGEKDGTVTNSERRISRQRAFLPPTGEARPDWWIISAVGRALGHERAFGYECPADVFREHAALTAEGNQDGSTRPLCLSGLMDLTNDDYDQLAPVQWPVTPAAASGTGRLFADGRFATDNGRAQLIAVTPEGPVQHPDDDWPLVVNSGRLRDQWHTMTRTGRAPRLWQHRAEPFIEVHPADLLRFGVEEGALARLSGPHGAFVGRVRRSDQQRPGEVFVPIHWNQQFASEALASSLIAPVVDPVSGQPESKHGMATMAPVATQWEARLLCRTNASRRWHAEHWSRVPLPGCDSWWLAGEHAVDWDSEVGRWLGGEPQVAMSDPACGRYRAARFHEGRLMGVLLVEPANGDFPALDWLAECFTRERLTEEERRSLLAARDVSLPDTGPVVCSCFQVGEKQIEAAVADGIESVEGLGQTLKCGTNCGSCIPELKAFLVAETG
ncbi:assimilatory nitrate reductase catalytic subunit [Tamilnaduibacter salinus]|uniref:Assimilatory nitrate reductase catalytic subunit n=1 Tax=Tamilnaduibacter salinus TaxID=1484056 RepID=A0A2U1CXW4_9GAMM|nr:nitrate reductase [Tamilnaduibacter salinus]PVY77326.1 assimilatory nitrate reductase catalytic subunit [Tamilnaduibacter salinus]